MAKQESTNEAANDTAEAEAVNGWASANWRDGDHPAVIVHPAADPFTLLQWAIGELEQIDVAMNVIHCGLCDLAVPPSEVAGIVRQPLAQALTVLNAAADRMFKAECARRSLADGEAQHG